MLKPLATLGLGIVILTTLAASDILCVYGPADEPAE